MLNNEKIREDFPILNKLTYLDSASTSLTPIPIVEAINDYFLNYNANIGRGAYKIAIKAGNIVDDTRENLANLINVKSNEIIFTKNTTEAINIISNGLNFSNNNKNNNKKNKNKENTNKKNNNIIVSDIEHHSNIIPWLSLANVEVKILQSENYQLNPEILSEKIDKHTKLVAITHISNSFGSKQDIKSIEKIAHDNGSLLLIDGAQSIGHSKIDIKKLKPDFMAFPGHKGLMGPVGTGFLYMKEEHIEKVAPTNLGGGTIVDYENGKFKLEDSPYRFEGGTLNIAGIIGLNNAINYINKIKIDNIEKYSDKLTNYMHNNLKEIENIEIYANPSNIHNIVAFNLNNLNPYDISKILDETNNICVRSGFHCAIPALKSYNISEGTIRASLHCYNNKNDIDKLIENLDEISRFLS
ncbi:MAG: cysteine desulfurase [Methanobrevibacter sp.]|jgi:cysteine desulfurase/selenocysteine lyase|nr:cysteine desulfurase [Candidatus Methanoflexus mossambicus]